MRYLIFCAILGLAACQSGPARVERVPAATFAVTSDITGQSSSGMMALINAQRTAQGLPVVREDARLSRAARAHAADMAAKGYFSHTGANGSRFFERAADAGYSCAASENIAQGQRTDGGVMASWMASPGHRRNILAADVTEFGIGRVDNTWVQMFGRGC